MLSDHVMPLLTDAVVTSAVPEPQEKEVVICEEEGQSPMCLFSIRSSSTSIDYSINKV